MSPSNSGHCYRSIIDIQAAGSRLLTHLAERFDHSPLAEWQTRLEAGEITLNGIPARGDEILAAGYPREAIDRVVRLIRVNEYKRRQAPVGIRITHRAFGRDWRYPITSKFRD